MTNLRSSFLVLMLFLSFALNAAEVTVRGIQCICETGSLGGITVQVTDTQGEYSLKWAGPNDYYSTEQSPEDISIPGEYTLFYINSLGCEVEVAQAFVSVCPTFDRIDFDVSQICEENGTGSIQSSTIGGSPELKYTWSNEMTTSDLDNLPAGGYTLTVSDSEGCEIIETVEIVNGYDESFSAIIQNESGCVCSITEQQQAFTLDVEGQNAPYLFNWSGPNGFSSTEQSPMVTEAGDYTVTIIGALGCEYVEIINVPYCISEPLGMITTISSCSDDANGEATFEPTDQNAVYTFLWSTGETTGTIDGLMPGDYQLTITDKNGCEQMMETNIEACCPIQLSGIFPTPACGDLSNGSIILSVTGGEGELSYQWSNGINAQNLMNIPAGEYTVRVRDETTCAQLMVTTTVESIDFSHNDVFQGINFIQPTCQGGEDGEIEIYAGDTYYYNWSDGVEGTGLRRRENLPSGLYCVTVTHDGSDCTVEECFNLQPEGEQDVYPYLKKLTITAANSGQLIYNGEWINTANGCIFFTGGMEILDEATIQSMVNGEMDWDVRLEFNKPIMGVVLIFPSIDLLGIEGINQIAETTISSTKVMQIVGDGQFSEQITILGQDFSGNLLLDLRLASDDLENCVTVPVLGESCLWNPLVEDEWTGVDDVHIIELECTQLEFEIIPIGNGLDKICAKGANTELIAAAWEEPSGSSVENLCVLAQSSGEYCVRAIDENGCVVKGCINYCKEGNIDENIHITVDAPCSHTNNGDICINYPASMPLSFLWEDGSSENCLNNILEGEYCVTITDHSCQYGEMELVKCIDLSSNSTTNTLSVTPTIISSCIGQQNGEICLNLIGGNGNYTYSWASGETISCITNLTAQDCYSVTISDECGQSLTTCFTVPEVISEVPTLGKNTTSWVCLGDNRGRIDLDFNGNLPPYSFVWINGEESWSTNLPRLINPTEGEYFIYATDVCGETYELGPVIVKPDFTYSLFYSELPSDICHDWTGEARLTVNLETHIQTSNFEYTIEWSTGESTESGEPTDYLSLGQYSVTITERSPNYCQIIEEIDLSGEGNWEISYKSRNGCANNSLLGSTSATELIFVKDSGSTIHTYSLSLLESIEWNDGSTEVDRMDLGAGTYCYTAILSTGCTATGCIEITDDEPSPTIEFATIERPEGEIDITVSGGSENGNTYLWSNGEDTEDVVGLGEGHFMVTVTNPDNGCFDIGSYTVKPCFFSDGYVSFSIADIIVTPISEQDGSDGSINALIIEGSQPLFYHWTKVGDGNFNVYNTPYLEHASEGEYCLTISDGCGAYEKFCRLVVFCGNYDYDPDFIKDKPCRGDLFSEAQQTGGIILNLGQEYGNGTQFSWMYSRTGGTNDEDWAIADIILAGFSETERNLLTPFSYLYRVTITDLTTCVHSYEVFLPGGVTEDFVLNDDFNQCTYEIKCNGQSVSSVIKRHDFQFQNSGFGIFSGGSPCAMTIVCPINGQFITDLDSDTWTTQVTGSNSVDGYCNVTVTCDYGANTYGITSANNLGVIFNPDECSDMGDQDDRDLDGILDMDDNCPTIYNPDQLAIQDDDEIGDACDCDAPGPTVLDSDSDGIPDFCDPCPFYQSDEDPDETDSDGDGVPDVCDICDEGPDDIDSDGDGTPDPCDVCGVGIDSNDADGDDIPDACDLCPNQVGTDDSDGDFIPNICDLCPYSPAPGLNLDLDLVDSDNDGVGDGCDPCPNIHDPSLEVSTTAPGGVTFCDLDGDGFPDSCDLPCPRINDMPYTYNSSTGCCEPEAFSPPGSIGLVDLTGKGINQNSREFPTDKIKNTESDGKKQSNTVFLKLIPNPTSQTYVNYEINWNSKISGKIVLMDARGIVLSQKQLQSGTLNTSTKGHLPLHGVAPGLYFVKASNEAGQVVVQKLVVTH